MRRFLLELVLIGGLASLAFPQAPAPGTVHSSIAVIADASNSYALYLPAAYSPAKRWPLLLVFDPFARGEVSVKLFQEAAEKYGFIVVGSNNSRNFEDPSTAVRLLWADVNARYAIDPRRLYVAGLSGGARVASSLALACKDCVAGVIANGAGLPQHAAVPGPEVADWFLVAGTTDFNYPELLHLDEALATNHAATRFVVYDGPHGWMPKEFTERALAWLQLRAMLKGTAEVDKEFVGKQFDDRLAQAQSARKGGDILQAVRAYREIAQDFSAFRDVKEEEATARSLAESEEFRKAAKNEKAILDLQDAVTNKVANQVAAIAQGSDDRTTVVAQLQTAVDDAYRDEKGSNPARAQAIERGLAAAFAYAVESGQQDMLKKDYVAARAMFQAGEIILPQSAWASYLLATAHVQLREKKPAIQELKKAMEKGLTNPKLLDDSAFDPIRNEPAFKELVARLSQASPK
jgi:dienelactone hydrolase